MLQLLNFPLSRQAYSKFNKVMDLIKLKLRLLAATCNLNFLISVYNYQYVINKNPNA